MPFSETLFRTSFDFPAIEQTVEATVRLAATHPTSLYQFFQRYTYFNGYASSLISRLASSIALSRYAFIHPDVVVDEEADRGMQISAQVLAAAADESANGVTHRSLAQVTLKTVGDYADLATADRNALSKTPDWMSQIIDSLIHHYQGTPNDLESLVRAMGFHTASEILGDRENALIDKVIRSDGKGVGFDAYLKDHAIPVQVEGHFYHPWCYILIHGSHEKSGVEAEHFECALQALNATALYCAVPEQTLVEWAIAGFSDFVQLQQRLFNEIYRECLQRTQTPDLVPDLMPDLMPDLATVGSF
ncbi:MAG: hypothetical protein MUF49_18620 [Oculatellaceae cyanobacterium Prado106]|jgi:hypothetical protein|nr:hypothetical protein [Oculatellaceae cyanobacterium Prado106]